MSAANLHTVSSHYVPLLANKISTVFLLLLIQCGDKVLVFSSAYRMVTDTLRFLQIHQQVETVVVDIPYPLVSAQQMVDAVH
ncbi:hypothetical protein EON65_24430 [archaeon]|nr:MAG: hypothetical protein EON65_24430 [archaeon]